MKRPKFKDRVLIDFDQFELAAITEILEHFFTQSDEVLEYCGVKNHEELEYLKKMQKRLDDVFWKKCINDKQAEKLFKDARKLERET